MKKITLALFSFVMMTMSFQAQTYSTGVINLSSTSGLEFTSQIDITSTEVTLTLIGPGDRWLGLGFDATNMLGQTDVVIFDGTNLTDRTFTGGRATPTLDTNQDWSISSNTLSSGVRTLVATRALDTGETNDYDFVANAGSINLVWARGNGATFNLANVKVYNALGKQIHNTVITNFDASIDISSWSNGIYLVSVEIANRGHGKHDGHHYI